MIHISIAHKFQSIIHFINTNENITNGKWLLSPRSLSCLVGPCKMRIKHVYETHTIKKKTLEQNKHIFWSARLFVWSNSILKMGKLQYEPLGIAKGPI